MRTWSACRRRSATRARLASLLGWHASPQAHVISRFPILDPPHSHGLFTYVEPVPGRVIAVANTHLPSTPYGPYRVRAGWSKHRVLQLERTLRLPCPGAGAEAAAAARRARHPGVPDRRLQQPVVPRLDARRWRRPGRRCRTPCAGRPARRWRMPASTTPTAMSTPTRWPTRASPGRPAAPRRRSTTSSTGSTGCSTRVPPRRCRACWWGSGATRRSTWRSRTRTRRTTAAWSRRST